MLEASGEPVSAGDPMVDPAEVERLFREHNATLLRFIAARIGSTQEAREIAQESYVQLLRLNGPGAISYLRAFLFKTAANLVTDRLRQRDRRRNVASMGDMDFVAFELSPERQVASEQAMTMLRAAVEELPPRCRQVFLLHRVHELSTEEIAKRVGIGERMARRYLARALEHLRARMDAADAGTKEV
ncbi:RNA polymerase sigma factor [Steroidobacter sp.]|uniref:RNA polymerase sigma factor n=1 Tax=Steroidobacter sp. TaxID=1978227 RepID=UPI001A5D854C|nr:sigma-70 family RNA polymerase sigma factor [Steroidobacter sp.]MBL8266698.1 sigma-70 family RNA polymerase sigma factor [Steroidobacter sp.]